MADKSAPAAFAGYALTVSMLRHLNQTGVIDGPEMKDIVDQALLSLETLQAASPGEADDALSTARSYLEAFFNPLGSSGA
jgi:hypothetical protein